MWSATARMRSASPTEVPPNFWTTSGIRTRLQTAHRPSSRRCPGRPGARPGPPDPGRAIRGRPRDWVGSRAVPSDKRARQRAAREARLAAEAKHQKRRKQIRNVIIVVVIAGGHRRHRLPGLGQQQQQAATPVASRHDHDHDHARPRPPTPRSRPQANDGGGEGRLPGQHQDHGEHPEVHRRRRP